MLWHAYVDESGDRGWKMRRVGTPAGMRSGSSAIFSMSAVVVPDGTQTKLLQTLDVMGATLGRPPGIPLHWQAIKQHNQRRYVAETLSSLEELLTVNVVMCKWHFDSNEGLSQPDRLYNYTFRLLIERLSWLAKSKGVRLSTTFSQVMGLHPAKLGRYLELLGGRQTNIEWNHLKMPLKVNTPANARMLQVADLASGACYAAFNPDDYGYTEQSYLRAMQHQIWCRPSRPLWKDGLKVAPWPNATSENVHPWFEPFCLEVKKARAVVAAR